MLYDTYLASRIYKVPNFIIKYIFNLAKTNMRLFNSQCSNKQLHVLEQYWNIYFLFVVLYDSEIFSQIKVKKS
jgi:hypothetical protein